MPRSDTAQALAALRDGGANPVRLRHIEALARRAQQHQGSARRLLDARVQQLLAASDGPAFLPSPAETHPHLAPRHLTLADLLTHITRHSTAPAPSAAMGAGAPELKAIRDYRSTWSRLHMEQRLSLALSKVPDNAGPLNTQRLLHQALAAMGELSPAYLQRFMVQVEALLWLNCVNHGNSAAGKKPGARRRRD